MLQRVHNSFWTNVYRAVCLFLYGIDVFFYRETPVVVLCYQKIDEDTPDSVSYDTFTKQVDCLLRTRKPVSLEDVYYHVAESRGLPKKNFAITFDDGFESVLLVKEYLSDRGIVPTVFVLSNKKVRSRHPLNRYLTNSELRDLVKLGWEIGCHSATHADFTKLLRNDRNREIRLSKKELREAGFPVRFFSYPAGKYTKSVVASVKKARYWMALSRDDDSISPKSNQYIVPRVVGKEHFSEKGFLASFSPSVILLNKMLHQIGVPVPTRNLG